MTDAAATSQAANQKLADLPGRAMPATGAYAKPSPKVSRQTKAKVLTPAEKAAFLASRPDLKPKS